MIYSVRWQLLLSMVAVILITVGMTAVFANLAANAEINRLQGQDAAARDERLTKLLSDTHRYNGSWLGSQAVLENASALYGEYLVLTDLQHRVVADSHDSVIGQYLSTTSTSRHKASVSGAEGPLGTLWFSPGVPAGVSPHSVEGGESSGPSLSLLLILSGLLAVGVAMILTFFVSHRILRPVETLARVSRQAARRDFTVRAQVQSRDEVRELARTFNTMLAELSRTEDLRRNLVGDVAHELRTPLTNIRGYVEGISDGVMQPDAETLASIRSEIRLLTRLIEDLQDLALVESGQMQLKVRSCDLGDLIRDASFAVHPQAQAKSISLEVDDLGGWLAEHWEELSGVAAGRQLPTATGAGSGNPQAVRWSATTGHPHGGGPPGAARHPPGAGPAVGPNLFGVKLRFPSRAKRAPGAAPGAGVRRGGAGNRGRPGLGEIL